MQTATRCSCGLHDLLVEPTGRLVETAGVLVSTLADGVIISANCYYDDSALLEQLVTGV